MPAQGVVQPKAEVNFLRLSRACHQYTKGEKSENELEEDMLWRKVEAYSRRMREFLEEMRRGDRPPPPERMADYERQLAAAVSEAETARRKWEEQNAPSKKPIKTTTAAASTKAASTPSPPPQSQQTLSDSSPIMTGTGTADRRAQLLGLASGGGVRHRGRARGNRGALHAEEVLREERMAQARMEEQLSAMTRHLKGNVQAIHATLVQDNARLGVLDNDLSANTDNLSKVNVKVDAQRAANRRTTCFQCMTILFVTLFFFGTFFFMRLFGKAAVLIHAEAPELTPFGGPVPEGGVTLTMQTRTKKAKVYFTLDGSDPRKSGAKEFDTKKPVYVGSWTKAEAEAKGGKGGCDVEIKAVAKGKGMVDSAVVSAKFAACAVEEEEKRKEEERRKGEEEEKRKKEEEERKRREAKEAEEKKKREQEEESQKKEEEDESKMREEKEAEEKKKREQEEKQRKAAEEERRKKKEEERQQQEAERRREEEEERREEEEARSQDQAQQAQAEGEGGGGGGEKAQTAKAAQAG